MARMPRRATKGSSPSFRPALCLVAAMLCGACTSGTDQAGLEKRRLAKLQAELEGIINRVEGKSPDSEERYRALRVQLKVAAAKAGDDLGELRDRAKKILAKKKKAYQAGLGKTVDQLKGEGEAAIKALLEAKPDALEARLGQLDRVRGKVKQLSGGHWSQFQKDIDELRVSLSVARQASKTYREVSQKSARMRRYHFYENALGLLDSYILVPAYAKSAFGARVRQAITTTKKEAEDYAKKESASDNIAWATILGKGTGLQNFTQYGASGTISAEDTQLVCDNREDSSTFLVTGNPKWQDYVLDLEFKIVRKGFGLAVRLSDDRQKFDLIPITDRDFSRLSWIKARVKVQGDKVQVISFTTFDVKEMTLTAPAGRFGIEIEPKSKVIFRNIRFKLLKSA